MLVDGSTVPLTSWKEKLMGPPFRSVENGKAGDGMEDFDLLEGDVSISLLNGSPSIKFSDKIYQILFRDMEKFMVLKLLRHNIGYSVLQNKIYSLWKPMTPLHMMDIENRYFLVKFHNNADCERTLSEGPWIIFGQYLIVQPWTLSFNPKQVYPSIVLTWIRLPSSSRYFYKKKII